MKDKHDGFILETAIRKLGFAAHDVSRALRSNRRMVYNWFRQRDLDMEVIQRIGKAIGHDFSNDFPDLDLKRKVPAQRKAEIRVEYDK
ncbi:MAG TPA: hypothetical protein VKB19_12060 [Pedobacter sp.]|nr:hypothetical protein [Pedobacter sp.]